MTAPGTTPKTCMRVKFQRRGYTLLTVLVVLFIVLAFVGVMQTLVVIEWRHDRYGVLDTQAQQLLESAQAWSRLHVAELAAGRDITLPLSDTSAGRVSGQAVLRPVSAGGVRIVSCEVTVKRADRRLIRRAEWPLMAAQP